jgi:dihydrofolate synthase/folylpolyglutamate synthase
LEFRLTLFERFFEGKEFVWKPGLDRIKGAVELSGRKEYPSIIVGGTNGKGSTSHLIVEALVRNGLKVGLFSSPHLFRFNERIKINLKEVSDEELNGAFLEIKPVVERFQLTYFESSLLLALKIFEEKRVDAAVFEVGLGGRLDATNVLKHQVAVLTNVSLDHTNYLGSTVREISEEKSEIFRGAEFGVVGTDNRDVLEVVRRKFKGELHIYGRDFWADEVSVNLDGTSFFYMGTLPVKTSLIGEFQSINASVAIRTSQIFVEKFFNRHFLIPKEFRVKLPGRFEVLSFNPPVVFDVAHNEGALSKLVKNLIELKIFGDVYYSGLRDKEQEKNLSIIGDYLRVSKGELHLLEIENERGMAIDELVRIAEGKGLKPRIIKGKVRIKEIKKPSVITGSFYLGGLIERG